METQPTNTTALELSQPNVSLEKKELASDVLAAQARALVQARYIVANSPGNKRDWDEVRAKILRDCDRPTFAETAIYKKPIGNSQVTGLSVRFAESARRSMGNILTERTVTYDDESKRIVRITLTDLESNTTDQKEVTLDKTIERKNSKGRTVVSQRINSYGDTVYIVIATEDELLTKESAMLSKIERQLTLKLLPGDIQDEALQAIRTTQSRVDKADPDAAKKKLVDAFDDLGIRVPEIKKFLGVDSLDSLQPSDLKQLREVYTAIKEGETNWRDIMEQREAVRGQKDGDTPKASKLTDKVRNSMKKSAPTIDAESDPDPALKEVEDLFGMLALPPMEREAMLKEYEGRLPELIEELKSKFD